MYWALLGLGILFLSWFFLAWDVPNWRPAADREFLVASHWSAPAEQVGVFGHVVYRYQAVAIFGAVTVCMVSAYFATLRAFQKSIHGLARWASLPLLVVGLTFAFFNWGWFHRGNLRPSVLKEVSVDLSPEEAPKPKEPRATP